MALVSPCSYPKEQCSILASWNNAKAQVKVHVLYYLQCSLILRLSGFVEWLCIRKALLNEAGKLRNKVMSDLVIHVTYSSIQAGFRGFDIIFVFTNCGFCTNPSGPTATSNFLCLHLLYVHIIQEMWGSTTPSGLEPCLK